jgi:AGCS family alanine or glycine:cation symporter
MIIVGIVILGGIKRIGNFAGKLVPVMGIAYLTAGLLVLGVNFSKWLMLMLATTLLIKGLSR